MRYLILSLVLIFGSCSKDKAVKPDPEEIDLVYAFIGGKSLSFSGVNKDIPINELLEIKFTHSIEQVSAQSSIILSDENNQNLSLTFEFFDQNKLIKISIGTLQENASYTLTISNSLMGINNEIFPGVSTSFTTLIAPLVIETLTIDGEEINSVSRIMDINKTPNIQFRFNQEVAEQQLTGNTSFSLNGSPVTYDLTNIDPFTFSITPKQELEGYREYNFKVKSTLADDVGRPFNELDLNFFTELDSTVKFPEITDDELLTLVQQQTFKYFWDFGHPVSGLSRERITSNDNVTIGGSGFGVMALIVGIERGFITREEGINRLDTIVNFLNTKANRFHGVWSHWLSGTTGEVNPFSSNDDGADLVESAFMIQGLLTLRQYLNPAVQQELDMINTINLMWEAVEWDWFTQGGQDVLYWHWSPNFGWEKNHAITGWNEALIVYVLAAASPTNTISKEVYTKGWSRDGNMVNNNNSYYGYTLGLRNDMGGPLFFSHYSFLGLDPRNLSDQYANYWNQNVNHSLINWSYCKDNPGNFAGYKEYSWGLTASDGYLGYSAHSPNNDRGVITPTASLSSFPYTPQQSMAALRHFYYILGDRLWGEYGFYDAFDVTNNWTASSYLAIDQGPIIIMIENYRTGLLWELFMSAPEVQSGLTKLGFTYE